MIEKWKWIHEWRENIRTNGCVEAERQTMNWLLVFSCRGRDAGEGT